MGAGVFNSSWILAKVNTEEQTKVDDVPSLVAWVVLAVAFGSENAYDGAHLHEEGILGEELVGPGLVAADVTLDYARRTWTRGEQEPLHEDKNSRGGEEAQ